MTMTRLILCALVLLASPAFAAETESEPVTLELPAAGIPAADQPAASLPAAEAVGCTASRSSVEQSEVEPTQSLLDLEAVLVSPTADPVLTLQVSGFSCGGPFPIYQPGACNQSCAPCYRNSDCPPEDGRPQKCCTYCP